jgi:predicted transcriptional regulator
MARKEEKNKAISLRKKGMSYSQIKDILGISKSTLSGWLSKMPLPKERLNELQRSDLIVEKIRKAKQKTRDARLNKVSVQVGADISKITNREFFIAGFFLYWAEGGKTTKYSITLSNTDPAMIRAFIKWLEISKLPVQKMYIRLHLYIDMIEKSEIEYWSKALKQLKTIFKKSYIKKSRLSELTYINKGHGTCNIIVPGRDVSEYVMQGLRVITQLY